MSKLVANVRSLRTTTAGRESEARYRKLVEESPDATFINRGEVVLYANPAALRLLGAHAAAQVIGASTLSYVHPDCRDAARAHAAALDSDVPHIAGGLVERRYLRLDGSVIDVEIAVARMVLPGGPARHVVVRDVTGRKREQAALQASEARYRAVVEASPDAILIFNRGAIEFVNPAGVKVLGAAAADQLIGRGMLEFVHAAGHAAALARQNHVRITGQPSGLFEQTCVRIDGNPLEIEGSAVPLDHAEGGTRIMVVMRDISARKRAEATMRESEARLRLAVEAAAMTDWEWDVASDHTRWGHRYEQLLGPLSQGAVHYPDFHDMVHAEDRERYFAAARATVETGVPYELEFRIVRTDGRLCWLRHSGRAVRDAHGKVERIVGVTQDVTRRHEVERELAASRQRSEALMQTIPAEAWLKDRDGRFVAVNRAWYRSFRLRAEQVIGRTNFDVFPPRLAAEAEREDQLVFSSRAEQRFASRTVVNGKPRWTESVKTPIFDDHGEVNGIAGVLYDTTERMQAEEELRASEERFRLFADSMDDVFWIYEFAPARFIYVNRAYQKITGCAPAALYADQRLWAEAIHEDDRARVRAEFDAWLANLQSDVYSTEYRMMRADGATLWIKDHRTKLRDAHGTAYRAHGIAEDITQRRRSEVALAESHQRRDALIESNPDPAWLKDCAGRYIAANRAWFARHGVPYHNIAGKTDMDLFGDAAYVVAIEAEDRQVIATRSVTRAERNGKFADNVEWAETVKAPVLDGAGKVVAIVGISHDISDRKRNERAVQQMNESLAQKTAQLTALNRELEAFSYSVSHDLRAPLRAISGFGDFLMKDSYAQLDAEGRARLSRILAASERMGMLIDDLLLLARVSRQEMSPRTVDLSKLAAESIAALRDAYPDQQPEVFIAHGLDTEADAGLMRIALDNLLGNAWKFTSKRRDSRIELGVTGSGRKRIFFVRDNGAGFDMAYAGKLFTPFQRMHSQAQFDGTGIGLATVKRIVERHHGHIWIESDVERGTTVYFTVGESA